VLEIRKRRPDVPGESLPAGPAVISHFRPKLFYRQSCIMFRTPSPSTSRSNLDSIFNSAIQAYKKKTGKDVSSHPLATELQSCDSPDAILAILRRHIPSSDQSQSSHDGFAKYLIPTVHVLYAFSATLGEGVGLVIIVAPSLLRICALTSITGFLTGKGSFCWNWRSPLGWASFHFLVLLILTRQFPGS
jgi:hypothetical protein